MYSEISWIRIVTSIAFIELNHPPYEIRIVFWKIVHIPLNKKSYFETDVLKVQLQAWIVIVLDVGDSDERVVVNNHTLKRCYAVSNESQQKYTG